MKRTHHHNSSVVRALVAVIVAGFVLAGSPKPALAMEYEYDSLNRLVKVTCDDGTVTEYAYDEVGNRTSKRVIPPTPPPALVDSEPPADGTLPKTENNVIWLVFDMPIEPNALPSDPLTIVPISGGDDVAGRFTYSLEPSDANDPNTVDHVLKCIEQGQVLADMTWYRIEPTASLPVQAFAIDLCTLRGDANGDGMVLANDYNVVKVSIGETTDGRADLNGDGMVLANDYNVVKVHVGNQAPPKPGGGEHQPPRDDLLPPVWTCGQAGVIPPGFIVAGMLLVYTFRRRPPS